MIQLRKIENESPWVISQLANNYEIAKTYVIYFLILTRLIMQFLLLN